MSLRKMTSLVFIKVRTYGPRAKANGFFLALPYSSSSSNPSRQNQRTLLLYLINHGRIHWVPCGGAYYMTKPNSYDRPKTIAITTLHNGYTRAILSMPFCLTQFLYQLVLLCCFAAAELLTVLNLPTVWSIFSKFQIYCLSSHQGDLFRFLISNSIGPIP